ncbi:MAG TPA: alanine--tRNA ligase [Tissierellia bacterium]|nr:alanine--tRNA ligase [Tissierellia bacterium]
MKVRSVDELRKLFLEFFESKEHLVEESYSLIPEDDPSILLIGAGMAPLKKYFTGVKTPPSVRMATCQKCVRVGDLEEVGKTARHLTFFEMLGNFSFGDYFKKESLAWGMEFLTEWLGIDRDRLWPTVFYEDDEAFAIWRDELGYPEEKITRLGREDNFWEIGLGPCGPCSEIYYDRGEEHQSGDHEHRPGCDCDRFMEVWNHVFTQFDKLEDGSYATLEKKNIDTGMGLERLAMVIQGADNVFEIDTSRAIIATIEELTGHKYKENSLQDEAFRVLCDHVRSVVFLIGDGVVPSNEGRGYVLRKLLRRALLQLIKLHVESPSLLRIAKRVIEVYGEAYPQLVERRTTILKTMELEENKFLLTIDRGMDFIGEFLRGSETMMSGEEAFKLYDTFGFPISLTEEILQEEGRSVDHDGFEAAMERQRKLSRAQIDDEIGWQGELEAYLATLPPTEFTGYDVLTQESTILEVILSGETQEEVGAGKEVEIILDRTPFYATGGGQQGDIGTFTSEGVKVEITGVEKENSLYVHRASIREGVVKKGMKIQASVDEENRLATARHHSATHLLHKAIHTVLGEEATQAGSFVDAHRLRFDFNYFSALTKEQLEEIERRVNDAIYASTPVTKKIVPLEEARAEGAVALFSEKYGKEVRVVSMGDSIELCGGTHVENTSNIGLCVILSERGIASGIRRIEAVCAKEAIAFLQGRNQTVLELASLLRSEPDDLLQRVHQMRESVREMRQRMNEFAQQLTKSTAESIPDPIRRGDVNVYAMHREGWPQEAMKALADSLTDKDPYAFVILVSSQDGKVSIVSTSGDKAQLAGYKSGRIVSAVAKILGGGGGGRDSFATAGGRNPSAIPEAMSRLEEFLPELP